MQIEVYDMQTNGTDISITLEAVCDSFSSLLWDVEYYQCGQFEIYIAANPRNIEIFKTERIVGRSDDKIHYGIIESVKLETDAENGDYLTVTGRFLMSLLSRRIIYPTINWRVPSAYWQIVRFAIEANCVNNLLAGNRIIPGLERGTIEGDCWQAKTRMQVSYVNLMEWVYKICEKIGGTVNIRLQETAIGSGQYKMLFDLSEGTNRSILQDKNPHIVFSDTYNNLLSFSYSENTAIQQNFAYVLGRGEGVDRKRTVYFNGDEPSFLDRYEVYVDAKDISDEEQRNSETVQIPDDEYVELLKARGSEKIVPAQVASESEIAVNSTQYQYNKDYFVGDYVTIQHKRVGLSQPKIQLVGMVESFDQNGRGLTPTFRI